MWIRFVRYAIKLFSDVVYRPCLVGPSKPPFGVWTNYTFTAHANFVEYKTSTETRARVWIMREKNKLIYRRTRTTAITDQRRALVNRTHAVFLLWNREVAPTAHRFDSTAKPRGRATEFNGGQDRWNRCELWLKAISDYYYTYFIF